MLIEELLLALLTICGYRAVTTPETSNMRRGSAGLEHAGRAVWHQIDAIADYLVVPPFTHPARLLVEAKAYSSKSIDVGITRNAVGVLKDISEVHTRAAHPTRFHYQYAIASTTPFTAMAKDYAFAHDVYLIELAEIPALRKVLAEVHKVERALVASLNEAGITVSDARNLARFTLQRSVGGLHYPLEVPAAAQRLLGATINAITREMAALTGAFLARMSNGLLLFLVPPNRRALENALSQEDIPIRIRHSRSQGWWIEDSGGRPLFNFDLPENLFRAYDEAGAFRAREAMDFKEMYLDNLQAIYAPVDKPPRVIIMKLDREWADSVREHLRETESQNP